MKIILLYGGRSEEHDVPALSAYSILSAICYKYYRIQLVSVSKGGQWVKGPLLSERPRSGEVLRLTWTQTPEKTGEFSGKRISPSEVYKEEAIVFPVLHGPSGEDGTARGFMETIDMPYVDAGVLASVDAMGKIMMRYLLQTVGIPQVPFVPVLRSDWRGSPEEVFEKCKGSLIYPIFIRPANMGSNIGVNKAENREGLQEALEEAFRHDARTIVEQGVEAHEIEVAILGNKDVRTALPGEVVKDIAFYDYDTKYINNMIETQIPAHVPREVAHQVQEYAKKTYIMLDGNDLSRCGFFLADKSELFLNELNTMPGFTDFSMYPLLWENMGLKCSDLIEELAQLALSRFKRRQEFYNNQEEEITQD